MEVLFLLSLLYSSLPLILKVNSFIHLEDVTKNPLLPQPADSPVWHLPRPRPVRRRAGTEVKGGATHGPWSGSLGVVTVAGATLALASLGRRPVPWPAQPWHISKIH